ncbi:hypothetical protein BKK81_24040 [Cupriavidus sp. USMAHM13]|uniref:hypothetical protein n=1 Tax=unclassified Cupriavidus TaxID=2640874 RepID=UPI0008A68251|nr:MULTISPECIES: hypothetical protein [unclassified Cupriavidus]AOZ02340.1 hypothetical protein BKK81_24040 [Cupriavidus sp. USMAHM13]
MLRFMLAVVAAVACSGAVAQVKIAVADLAYKDTVRESFYYEAGYQKSRDSGSASYQDSAWSGSGRAAFASSQESGYVKASGEMTRIEYGELRRFTADIKGELIKGRAVRVVQGKPYSGPPSEALFNVRERIRKGDFAGADYVLFGVVNSVEWRNDVQPVQGTRNSMLLYSLELGTEFSLINTRTMEVRAAFSAVGEGNDNKIWSAGAVLTPNKARVMQAVSRSLAEDAVRQLDEQFGAAGGRATAGDGDPGVASAAARGADRRQAVAPAVKVFD